MTTLHDPVALIKTLCAYEAEQEWFEFKENYAQPERIGIYISALANGAILQQKTSAYLVFGVKNENHEIVGTTVTLKSKKQGAEPLEFWLAKTLNPNVHFEFVSCEVEGKRLEIVHIMPPYHSPIKFNGIPYIRIGETTPKLSDHPEKERKIWEITSRYKFETSVLSEHVSQEFIVDNFHSKELFEKLGTEPSSHDALIGKLLSEKLIATNNQNQFDVFALLAILCASNFEAFPKLARKAPRLIIYEGNSKLHTKADFQGTRGYSLSFDALIETIMGYIPSKEIFDSGIREVKYDIPKVAVRELVANAMIHQDFTINGAGPVIEVFTDRIKITNPGEPLVEPQRFIDAPSRSRNDKLTNFMRRLGICEERGSGVDRAIHAIERLGLPAPLFRSVANSTEVTIFGAKEFKDMSKEDRIRACFQHTALKFEMNEIMTNATLRKRLKLSDKQYPQASRVIADSIQHGLIKPYSETQGNKNAKYIPFWG